MKHLNKFESIKSNCNVGDYVVCADNLYPGLENFVGEIIKIDRRFYYIQYNYEELPIEMRRGFQSYGGLGIRTFYSNEIIRKATTEEIKESKLKKELSKYNL